MRRVKRSDVRTERYVGNTWAVPPVNGLRAVGLQDRTESAGRVSRVRSAVVVVRVHAQALRPSG